MLFSRKVNAMATVNANSENSSKRKPLKGGKKSWTIGRVAGEIVCGAFFLAGVVPVVPVVQAEEVQPIQEVFEPAPPADASKFGKVAVVQWAPWQATPVGVTVEQAEAFKQQNREQIAAYVREAAAKGARLIITPEFSVVGYPDIPELPPEEDEYRNREDIRPYVETVPGPSTRYFGNLAKQLGVYLQVGFAERDPATDIYYNVAVALNPRGEIVGKYRKVNLYQGEHHFLSPGKGATIYETPFGRVGMIICADVYGFSPMSELIAQKVDVLALSTSWAQMNSGMGFFTRGATRAKAYLLAANQTYFPDSGVINPDGTKQSHIRQSAGVAYGYLPLKGPLATSVPPVQQSPIQKK